MKRSFLLATIIAILVFVFVGCHKDSFEFGKVGVLNLALQRGYESMNKSAVESFDARVTIYYSTDDTISYNCRFIDTDGDNHYTNDPAAYERIYVRREAGFWVGVWAVIQGDTVSGMSDPTALFYLSEENPVIDVTIVLEAGYPRIVINANPVFNGETFLLYGEVLEGLEQIERCGFLMRPGLLSEEEKLIWSKRVLMRLDFEELFEHADYMTFDAEMTDNNANKFVGQIDMSGLGEEEYSVVAIAMLRTNGNDTVQKVIHSSFVSMKFSLDGVYIDEPYYNGDTVTLYAYYAGSSQVNECGFVLGFSESELTDTMPSRQTDTIFSLMLFDLQPNTTYYYKAYVKTSGGLVESGVGQFRIQGSIQEFAVYTESATDVGETSATLNGYVTSTDGVQYCGFILNMGTYNDTIMIESFAGGSFSYQVSNLTASTTYYYQAFANRSGWVFGQEVSFTTANSGQQGTSYSQPTGNMDGYGYVDLGLPSGLLWAYSNIGATNPEDYGNYYAWGETDPKETYDWSTYRYCNGSDSTLTKYCNNSSYGNEGFTDTLTTLEAEDDAATANWGTNWRMPTLTEILELMNNCDTTWVTINGINGMLFTSRTNGNSIFLPAAGRRTDASLNYAGSNGYYWSSSYDTDYLRYASSIYFDSGDYDMYEGRRDCGHSVRAVCVQSKKKRK